MYRMIYGEEMKTPCFSPSCNISFNCSKLPMKYGLIFSNRALSLIISSYANDPISGFSFICVVKPLNSL